MENYSEELKEKLIKAKSAEEAAELLKAEGHDAAQAEKIWGEIEKNQEEDAKLSVEELDAVSGGYLWFGKDAPDGHELTCLAFYYDGWDDFDERNKDKYCKGTKGKKHDYEDTMAYQLCWGGGISVQVPASKCKKCGWIAYK